jgi:hypothetical protein
MAPLPAVQGSHSAAIRTSPAHVSCFGRSRPTSCACRHSGCGHDRLQEATLLRRQQEYEQRAVAAPQCRDPFSWGITFERYIDTPGLPRLIHLFHFGRSGCGSSAASMSRLALCRILGQLWPALQEEPVETDIEYLPRPPNESVRWSQSVAVRRRFWLLFLPPTTSRQQIWNVVDSRLASAS